MNEHMSQELKHGTPAEDIPKETQQTKKKKKAKTRNI
jgi:hypothetical protein